MRSACEATSSASAAGEYAARIRSAAAAPRRAASSGCSKTPRISARRWRADGSAHEWPGWLSSAGTCASS